MSEPGLRVTVPDWQLERYRLGELPADELESVRRAVAEDPGVGARLQALDHASAALLRDHPPRVFGAVVRARQAQEARGRVSSGWRAVWAVAGSLGLVALSLAVWAPWRAGDGPGEPETTRIKGLRPQLLVYRQTPRGAERLRPSTLARKNEVVQLAYQAAGRRYGVIASVDGRGAVTLHLPAGGKTAAALTAGKPVPLATAYRLDDAPVCEVFYFVAANGPFEVASVLEAVGRVKAGGGLEQGRPLSLAASFDQSVFILQKESSR